MDKPIRAFQFPEELLFCWHTLSVLQETPVGRETIGMTDTKITLSELQVKEDLNCPVCWETPKSAPVFQCPNGHLVCNQCHPKLQKCPICQVPLAKIRSLICEQLLALAPSRDPNQDDAQAANHLDMEAAQVPSTNNPSTIGTFLRKCLKDFLAFLTIVIIVILICYIVYGIMELSGGLSDDTPNGFLTPVYRI